VEFIDAASGQLSLAPIYVGDETLIASLWRTLTAPPLAAVVTFGQPQHTSGRDRRQWAADLHDAVMSLRES
jgi:1-acyl-sn-glycerol-3-phosphate acyltransferase